MFQIVVHVFQRRKISFLLTLLIILCHCDAFSGEFEPGGKPDIEIVNPGAEILLGALVNIRSRGVGLFGCGERRKDGLTSAEALKWVTDELNRKIWSSSSSNISIGLQIMDGCSRMRITTSQLTDFLPELKGGEVSNAKNFPYKFGIIDDIGLENEVDVFNTLEELGISVLKTEININSQQEIITAVLNILQELRWDHVAIVHSNSQNSLSLLKIFTKSFKKFDLCIPWIINIENAVVGNNYDELHSVLKSRIPMVSLLESNKHNLLFKNMKDVTKEQRKIPVLLTDIVKREHLISVPSNAVQLYSLVSLPEKDINFEAYFWRNSKVIQVKKEDDLDLIQRTKTLRKIQVILNKVSLCLRDLMVDFCENEVHICQKILSPEGRAAAFEQLDDVDWTVEQELYGLMEYQFRNPEGHILLHKILTYNRFKNVDVFDQNLPFFEVTCENDSKLYKPECNCLEAKSMRRSSARNIVDQNKKQRMETDNEPLTSNAPIKKQIDHFTIIPTAFSSFRDPVNAILACLILLGSFFTLFTGQYFATFAARPHGGLTSGTSIIGYFILIGLFFLYVTNLSFILTPSLVSCTIRRFGTSSSYAVIFSGMLIKVWAVWRQTKSEKEDILKPSTLIVLPLSLSALQILFSALWLALIPPRIHFDSDKWICYPSGDLDSHLLVSMIYIIGILLATAILAIRTTAKNNNNETRWILISSALVAVLISCWGIAIATGVWQHQRTAIMNLVSATILLSCLYIPKMRAHSKLKKAHLNPQPVLKLVDEFPGLPPYPLILDCNVPSPPSSEDISDSSYSNQAYSFDGGTESMSLPFEIDTTSISDIGPEPLTFSTFFNDDPTTNVSSASLDSDPTQIVPSSLYPLDMFNNEAMLDDKEHYEPGTNEFTPQHRISSQLYLYQPPDSKPTEIFTAREVRAGTKDLWRMKI